MDTRQSPGEQASLTLSVNGEECSILAYPGHTLLQVLRDDLGLTGAKRGCDDGTCGSCTVLIDGAPTLACRLPATEAGGRELSTIEGLGAPGALHPLQEAFIQTDAVQCGFCTPGMILAAKALLDRNPAPTRDQIVGALEGNLCRCTGYAAIIDAITAAAEGSPEGPVPGSGIRWGADRRADAPDKVLGTARYAADLTMPGMLHGAILRSPHAHAEILGIDTTAALALSGVVAVLTAEDVPGLNRFGRAVKDQPILADDRVRFVGDSVAAVAAESAEVAARALSLIRVSYRPLPAVLDPVEALEPDAPLVHADGNLLAEREVTWGDPDAGLAAADVIVDDTFTTPWQEHAYLEPEAALAYLDDDGQLVVRSAIQYSFMARDTIAETLDLPVERVRFIPTPVGGAFGGKNDPGYQCVTGLLALKTGRPVRLVYSRAESMTASYKRHPFRIRCRVGATRDGRLTALKVDMVADTGAYASSGPAVLVRSSVSGAGPYHFPGGAIHARAVYTNNVFCGAFRGLGAPQSVFALETQMAALAAKLGIDPLEFRRMNRRRSDPADAMPQELEQEGSFGDTIEAVRPYYRKALAARDATSEATGRWRRGVGVASMRYGIGASGQLYAPGRANAELGLDGRVRVTTGVMDLGQGSDTVMRVTVARELGLELEDVTVASGDTGLTFDAGTTGGSRVTYYVGNGAHNAAVQLRDAVLSTASDLLEMPAEDLELDSGSVTLRNGAGASSRQVSFAEVAEARSQAGLPLIFEGAFDAAPLIRDSADGLSPYPVYVSATQLAEVDVDLDSGEVRVLRMVAAHDVGRAVLPLGLKGQIEGGVAQGVGYALMEGFRPGETLDYGQYRIPTARDVPEVVTLFVENIDPSAGLGAKGAAECAMVPVAPAITNAIADATGLRVHDLPATPARLTALKDRQS